MKCDDGKQCTPISDMCDGIFNCHDESDEIYCQGFNITLLSFILLSFRYSLLIVEKPLL